MSVKPRLDELLELRHQARAIGVSSHHLVNSHLSGLYASVFRGQGLDFDDLREYQAGDDIRNMEWHTTARTGVPHVKLFREERERTVLLCVEQGPAMRFGTRGSFKSVQAARAAALIGWSASQHQDRVGGVLYGETGQGLEYFRPSRGRKTLWRLLRTLTRDTDELESTTETQGMEQALAHLSRLPDTGSLVFVVGSFQGALDALEYPLMGLAQRHEVVLLPIDDQADYDMPDLGRVWFDDGQGGVREVDTHDAKGRDAYKQQWQQRRDQLNLLCHRVGARLLALDTQEDVHVTLTRGLSQWARRHGGHV